ncbi:hypothetical protein [Tunturibacter empetritectus]|nr:hypothetical protein [Edaphobacter lichenicola]
MFVSQGLAVVSAFAVACSLVSSATQPGAPSIALFAMGGKAQCSSAKGLQLSLLLLLFVLFLWPALLFVIPQRSEGICSSAYHRTP